MTFRDYNKGSEAFLEMLNRPSNHKHTHSGCLILTKTVMKEKDSRWYKIVLHMISNFYISCPPCVNNINKLRLERCAANQEPIYVWLSSYHTKI